MNDPIEFPNEDFLQDFERYQIDNLAKQPAEIFQFAVYDIEHVQSEMERYPIQAVPRMLLTQYFSAIEAYLSDRLIGLVNSDETALATLVKNNKEWADEKISVVVLAANPNALKEWVKRRLVEVIYHNFVKVDLYYQGALGLTIFPDMETKTTLMRFIPIRHDCVHRYGRDKEGNDRKITADELDVLAQAVKAVVSHVEGIFSARDRIRRTTL